MNGVTAKLVFIEDKKASRNPPLIDRLIASNFDWEHVLSKQNNIDGRWSNNRVRERQEYGNKKHHFE